MLDSGDEARPVGTCGQRGVLLDPEADAPRFASFDVQRVQPGPGAIIGRGEVEQRAPVEERRVQHTRVVKRHALQVGTVRRHAPDVHLVGRNAAHEIDVLVIGRPGLEVVVHALRPDVDLARCAVARLDDEGRVARVGRVIDDATAVA